MCRFRGRLAEFGEVPCLARGTQPTGEQLGLAPGAHAQVHPAPGARGEKEWALGPGDGLGFLGAPSGLWLAFLTQRHFYGPEEALPSWDTRETHLGC